MTRSRLAEITARYASLRLTVVGDFCLDRYLEIDPARAETSLETGLAVHNVARVRSQPGAAGTIVSNLVALGVGAIRLIGFCGEDGEGYELLRALRNLRGVSLDGFLQTPARATFTYTKPLVIEPGAAPRELHRLDIKNWTPTPPALNAALASRLADAAREADAIIVMDQVDTAGTGVVTAAVLAALGEIAARNPQLPILADSRRGLRDFPAVILKMNAHELAMLTGVAFDDPSPQAAALASARGKPVIVTLSERGILGAMPGGEAFVVPAWPVAGPIDIVGAGDAVTANVATALAAGGTLREAIALANAAASIVIHQLGTTGTATVSDLAERLGEGECDSPIGQPAPDSRAGGDLSASAKSAAPVSALE
jgi:rfaE bifunctional protein kinase chain/domain